MVFFQAEFLNLCDTSQFEFFDPLQYLLKVLVSTMGQYVNYNYKMFYYKGHWSKSPFLVYETLKSKSTIYKESGHILIFLILIIVISSDHGFPSWVPKFVQHFPIWVFRSATIGWNARVCTMGQSANYSYKKLYYKGHRWKSHF
jgi:hypothetical protein